MTDPMPYGLPEKGLCPEVLQTGREKRLPCTGTGSAPDMDLPPLSCEAGRNRVDAPRAALESDARGTPQWWRIDRQSARGSDLLPEGRVQRLNPAVLDEDAELFVLGAGCGAGHVQLGL